MAFLSPAFLLLGLLALPIILLYMLRLRRRAVRVSSTLLWEQLLRDREANTFWQRLRRNRLLFLQLLILALLVLALARPFWPTPTVVSGNLVVLLDGSASMAATDVATAELPTRFAAAQEAVEQLIGELSGGDQMTIILVGSTPTVLAAATADRAALRSAVRSAVLAPGGVDWAAALALAAGAAQGFSDARIAIVSDGGLPDALPPLPGEVVYIPIGARGDNLALASLATRRTAEGVALFARVVNHSDRPQRTVLSIAVDGALFDSRWIDLEAGGAANATWLWPEGAGVVEARLSSQTADDLPLDDVAWAVHDAGAGRRVLLVGPGNLFLEQLFAVLPGFELVKGGPTFEPGPPYDLYVFDRAPLPDPAPAADLLLIAPPADHPLVQVGGVISDTRAVRLADSPLLQYVEWGGVAIRQAQQIDAPWAQPLIAAADGPLLLAGEVDGRRAVIFAFNLLDSDLPLQVAFPILMANLTAWLAPGQVVDVAAPRRVGEPVAFTPGVGATLVTVTDPVGNIWQAEPRRDAMIYGATDRLGVYQVAVREGGAEREAGAFAVNLFDAAESRIAPAERIRIGATTLARADADAVGQRELWPWLLVPVLLVLLVEWRLYHHGALWPRRSAGG